MVATTKPVVNGSSGTWGSILNQALTDLETAINTNAAAALPLSTVTTKGDLIVATGSGAVARQAAGTNGQTLVADSTQTNGLKWASPGMLTGLANVRPTAAAGYLGATYLETDTNYMSVCVLVSATYYWVPLPGSLVASLRQTTAQSLTSGTVAAMAFQTAAADRYGAFASGNTTYTLPVPGRWELTGAVNYAANTANSRYAYFVANGSTAIPGGGAVNGANAAATAGISTVVARPTIYTTTVTTDTISLYGLQNSGSTLSTDVATAAYNTTLTIKYLGPA